MAAPSFAAPTWATTGTPASSVLTSGLRTNGYANFDPMTADQVNRWRYEVGQWLAYVDDELLVNFEVEHHNADSTDALGNALSAGAHKAVNAASLSLRATSSGVGGGGTLSFPQAGDASDNTALISLGTIGSGDCILAFDHPATNAIELELRGGVWRSGLQGSATWAFEVDSGSDEVLYIRNVGAGNADVDIDGDTNLQGTLDVAGLVTASAGVVADVDSDNLAYRLAAADTYEADITPEAGGYSIIHDSGAGATDIWYYSSASPPHIAPSGTTTVTIRRPLRVAHNSSNAPASGVRRVVTGVSIRYYRTDGSSTLTWRLVECSRTGSSARTVMQSRDESSHFTTTSSWTTYTDTFTATLDEAANYYYVEFAINQGGPDECRIGQCHLTMTTADATKVML